jgi:glycosyltransferase involved in cell wall biosynthesis
MVGVEPVQFSEVIPDVSIVVPLRDEELNIVPFHDELSSVLEHLGATYELILVDDGSEDGTFAKLAEIQARDRHVRVIRFERNFGQTAAFAAGFARARGRFIVTSDGDLQNDPADIPRLLELVRTHDVVVGWRKHRKDSFLTRHVPSVVANYLIGLVAGIRLHDNGCSLKVFRAEVVKPLKLRHGMHRYLPAIASQLGSRVTEVIVNHRPRRHGHSKYGLSRTFRVIGDLAHLRSLMRQAVHGGEPAAPLYQIREERGPGLMPATPDRENEAGEKGVGTHFR